MNRNRQISAPVWLSTPLLPVFLAIVLRLIYWLQVRDEAWFIAPGMDPEFYSQWASAITAGHGADYLPFPRAPLYAYLLAGIHLLLGDGWLFPRLLNLTADLVTLTLIYRITRKLAGSVASLIAAMIYALCGAAVYFTGELLMTSLETCLATAFLYTFILTLESCAARPALTSGVWLGLTSLFRPNSLLLLPFSAGFLLVNKAAEHKRLRIKAAVIHTLAVILIILPVIIINYSTTHRFIPVATQGGVNFYIGNARTADGWSSTLPGVGNAWLDDDARCLAETEAGHTLDPAGVSNQLWKMGWCEITAGPVAWLKLLGRKLLILTNIREVGNNRPLALARDSSPMISLLFLISLGLLIPLALPGVIALRCNPVAKVTLLYSVVYAASVMLFFINMRYRMPLVPPAAIFTGVSFVVVIRQMKERRRKLMALIAIPAAILLTFPPWVGHDFDPPAQVQFVSGNAYLRLNRPAEAIGAYDQAVQLDSTYPDLHLNRGAALMMLGDSISAASEFHTELHQNEKNPRAWNNLGVILESRGDLDSALVCYNNSLASAPYMTDARRNATRLELRRADDLFKSGFLVGAEPHIRRAAELSPADPAPAFRLALLAGARGDISQAKFLLQRTLTLDPNYPPARVLLDRLESP